MENQKKLIIMKTLQLLKNSIFQGKKCMILKQALTKERISIIIVTLFFSIIIIGCFEKESKKTHETIEPNLNVTSTEKVQEDNEEVEFEVKYSDPRDFVKLKWNEGIPRKRAVSTITKDKIPLLHEMLQDPNYTPYWHNVAMLICHISDDPDSVPVLLDYFQRYDEQQDRKNYPSKIACLIDIGRIAKQDANELLRKAITEEGASELTQAWIDKSKHGDYMGRQEAIDHIRLCAMEGLLFTGIKENVELIENIYEKEMAVYKKTGEVSGTLVDAAGTLVARDYIAENSLDEFRNLQTGDGSTFLGKITKYYSRYAVYDKLLSPKPVDDWK